MAAALVPLERCGRATVFCEPRSEPSPVSAWRCQRSRSPRSREQALLVSQNGLQMNQESEFAPDAAPPPGVPGS
jgi:hypothetical protein